MLRYFLFLVWQQIGATPINVIVTAIEKVNSDNISQQLEFRF